jgi:hypothetical protein
MLATLCCRKPREYSSPFELHGAWGKRFRKERSNCHRCNALKTASFGGATMTIDLIYIKLCDHFGFDEHAPSIFVENPPIGNPTSFKFFFARLFLSGILLL